MIHQPPPRVRVIHIAHNARHIPPRFAEYAYYALVFYAIMASALGLAVPLFGAGMLAVLAVYCVWRLGARMRTVYAPIAPLLGCGIAYLTVQLAVHHEPLMGEAVRAFVTWMLALLIVQALAWRQGFLHRFSIAAFIIGLATIPYLELSTSSSADFGRMGLDHAVSLANPNDLGAWFGFCCVYCIIAGFETKRAAVRVTAWLAAIACLSIVALTVSRAPLLAGGIAILIALRRQLKYHFVLVMVMVLLSGIIYELGFFARATASYTARGTEETGRFLVWPLAIERFLSAPLTGVGASKVLTYVPERNSWYTPHNSFIFLAIASGIVPLVFFLGYWIRAVRRVWSIKAKQRADAPLHTSLFIYSVLISLILNTPFMSSWMIVTLAVVTRPPYRLYRVRRQTAVSALPLARAC